MKVTLAKHGGMAAAIQARLPPRVVDAEALPQPAAAELRQLVAAAEGAHAAQATPPGRGADMMTYVITVEDDGRTSVLRQSDAGMSPAFAALLEWIERRASTK